VLLLQMEGPGEARRGVAILGEIALQARALETQARHFGAQLAVPEIGAAALAPLTLKGVLQAAAFIAFLLQAPLCNTKTKKY
jgi:hypothetical protein